MIFFIIKPFSGVLSNYLVPIFMVFIRNLVLKTRIIYVKFFNGSDNIIVLQYLFLVMQKAFISHIFCQQFIFKTIIFFRIPI